MAEALERVEAMVQDEGQTWDLSDNDKAALRTVAAQLRAAEELVPAIERLIPFVEVLAKLSTGQKKAFAIELARDAVAAYEASKGGGA